MINMLTNLKGHEIKEMITRNTVRIESLDVRSLEKLLDYETDMLCLGKGDMDIINECARLLDEKNESADKEIDFDAVIARTKEKNVIITDTKRKPLRHIKISRIAVVAAVLIIVTVIISAVASSASGDGLYESFVKKLWGSVGEKVVLPNGEELKFLGDNPEYSTVEALEKGENIDLSGKLFPTSFPEGYELQYYQKHIHNGKPEISAITNSPYVGVSIHIDYGEFEVAYDEVYVCKGIEYFIKDYSVETVMTSPYSAFAFVNNDYYYISAMTKEDLIYIIDNLEEKQ